GQERRLAVGGGPNAVKASDFNGDGRLDLAVVNVIDLAVFLGRGDGTFTDPVRYPAGQVPREVVASDFNGDGRLDLATTSTRTNDVMILLGRGDGTFQPGLTFQLDRSDGRQSDVRTGDFNRDGRLDLAVVNQEGGTISVLLGRGDGTFADQVPCPVGLCRVRAPWVVGCG